MIWLTHQPSAPNRRSGDESLAWAKWGVVITAVALVVSYFPAAQQMHWPPYQNNGSDSRSNGSSPTTDSITPTTATSPSPETTETAPTSDPTTTSSTTDQTTDSTTTTAQPTDVPVPGLTDAESNLLSRIRPWVLRGCQVGRSAETGGIVAAVFCQPTQFGPSRNVGVFEFASSNAVQQALSHADAQTININNCGSGQYIGIWNHNGYVLGQMVCLMVNGYLHIEWSFRGLPMLVAAEGSPGPFGLVSWWRNNANCVNTN